MKKELKDQVIESISAQLKEYSNFYITDIAGLNAKDTCKLRRACFDEGIKLTVVKNTLFAHVLKGIDNPEMQKLLETLVGNTAIMYCNGFHRRRQAGPARRHQDPRGTHRRHRRTPPVPYPPRHLRTPERRGGPGRGRRHQGSRRSQGNPCRSTCSRIIQNHKTITI